MNSEHNPALADWHRSLYDWEALMDIPSAHRAELKRKADWMLQSGIIDPLEHWDLCTLAQAAETHALESRYCDFLQRHCQYNLVREDGSHAGYMDGVCIYFNDSMHMIDRGVCRRGEHHYRVIQFDTRLNGGTIIHDRMECDGHPPYRLVQRSRRENGVIIPV